MKARRTGRRGAGAGRLMGNEKQVRTTSGQRERKEHGRGKTDDVEDTTQPYYFAGSALTILSPRRNDREANSDINRFLTWEKKKKKKITFLCPDSWSPLQSSWWRYYLPTSNILPRGRERFYREDLHLNTRLVAYSKRLLPAPSCRMSRAQMARLLISQRLSAAAEDIFRLFEGMITEYEEHIYHQREKLDASTDKHPTEYLQLPVYQEEVTPEQQERNPILVLGEEPETRRIKEEQKEQQGEAGSIKLTLILEKDEGNPEIPLKKLQVARDEEKSVTLPSTSTEQMKTELDGEDCGVSGPASVLNLTPDLEPVADVQLQNSDDTDTNIADWSYLNEIGSHTPNPGQIIEGHTWSNRNNFQSYAEMSDELELLDHAYSSLCCKVCKESFLNKRALICHVRAHTRDCGLCGKHLEARESLEVHLSSHKKCNVCGKRFSSITLVERHMRTHTGERPFCCPVCGKCFGQKGTMTNHIISHTGVKPFGCMLCSKVFSKKDSLNKHMRVHSG